MLVPKAGIHKMLVRIVKQVQKQSDVGLHCLPWALWQAINVRNFRRSTVIKNVKSYPPRDTI